MTTVAIFTSRHVYRLNDFTDDNLKDALRTIHGGRYLVVDALNLVTDTLNLVTNTGHSIVDANRDICNSPHSASVIDSMRGLQDLHSSHLSLLLSQTV